jgi:hypothetical protein
VEHNPFTGYQPHQAPPSISTSTAGDTLASTISPTSQALFEPLYRLDEDNISPLSFRPQTPVVPRRAAKRRLPSNDMSLSPPVTRAAKKRAVDKKGKSKYGFLSSV